MPPKTRPVPGINRWLTLPTVEAAIPVMRQRHVSAVARSRRGFIPRYRAAGGDPEALSPAWQMRRDNFVRRHMAQVQANEEPLWEADGSPTRRHLALIAWAYSPHPARVIAWLRRL